MTVPLPRKEVFRFFENPRNLKEITPPQLSFQVTSPGEIEMRSGASIDYTIRWLGLPMKWRTRITGYHPPLFFVDEQVLGPYKLWRHRHDFDEADGVSTISDRVEYELPMGAIGRVAHGIIVGRQLKGIFAYRQRAITRILGVPGIHFTDPQIVNLGTA
jgi:ligand-binding SRPBCC domain-containing protein